MNKKALGSVLLKATALFTAIGLIALPFGSGSPFLTIAACCALGWWFTTPAAEAMLKEREKKQAERRRINPQFLHQRFDQLAIHPNDRNLCDEIENFLKISDPFVVPKASTRIFYDRALQVLADNPETAYLKQFCLQVGRWHCHRSRSDGNVTIYDEQAIQNDISVRVH